MSSLDFLFAGSGGLTGAVEALWSAPAAGIAKAAGIGDRSAVLGADAMIDLGQPDKVWLVLSGTADVFVLQENGVRRHLMRVPSGGIACGMAAPNVRLVPSNQAELVSCDWPKLLDQARSDPALRPLLAGAIDTWLVALTGVLPSPPTDVLSLKSQVEQPVPAGGKRNMRTGIAWVPVDDARWLVLGPKLWSLWETDATITPLPTEKRLEEAGIAAALATLADRALAVFADRLHAAHRLEADRLRKLSENHTSEMEAALNQLAAAVDPKAETPPQLPTAPLLAAATLVWQALHIDRVLEHRSVAALSASEATVEDVARAAGLFCRKVRLEEDWWRVDHGPLLVFVGDAETPSAAIPSARARYNLVPPQGGAGRSVDRRLASTVKEEAWEFFEPLPDKALSVGALLRFGMLRSGRDLTVVLWVALLTGLVSLVTPVVTAWVMDPVIPEAQKYQLMVLISALVVAGGVSTAFSLVQSLAMLRMEGRMAQRVQSAIWDRLMRLPSTFFRKYTVGDLTNRAMSIDAIRRMVTGTMTTSMLHGISGSFSAGMMIYYAWKPALAAIILAAIYVLVIVGVGRRILALNRQTVRLQGHIQGIVLQLLRSVGKLRVAGAEPAAFGRWAGPYSELSHIGFRQSLMNAGLLAFKNAFHFLAIGVVIGVIAWFGEGLFRFFETADTWAKIQGEDLKSVISTADFVAFNVAFGQFLAAVFGLAQTVVRLAAVKPLFERVEPILDTVPEPAKDLRDPGELSGRIEVTSAVFRYAPDGPKILHGLSFDARPGEMIALVGQSGAGKSTVVRLLLGFEELEAGSVFFDGQDLKNLNKQAVRRQIGSVLQDGHLLAGSLFNNITLGAHIGREEAEKAATLAGMDRDIAQMPMGLDTYIGEGGSTLSGGQRQRLMIARALVRKPRILIFDEATSALDNETQAIVTRGIDSLNATRIVIAHRLSTMANADRIFYLEAGRVVETGSYQGLMAKNGRFAALAKRQIA